MRRRHILVISLLFVLVGILGVTFKIQNTEASGTIYIRADGDIDPPTANITTTDNVTYVFTGNVNDTIVVERDNIIIDGRDYLLHGTGGGTGLYLFERSNITIKSLQIINFSYGVYFYQSSNITVINSNIIANSDNGVHIRSSNYNNITENQVTNNGEEGIYLLDSSNYNTIYRNNIMENEAGVSITSSTHNEVYENNITDNGGVQVGGGIWLDSASLNTISGNNITANDWHGIDFETASNNTIFDNNITANENRAIMLDSYSMYNNITENNIIDNYKGIEIAGSSHYNIISENNITLNDNEGIYIEYSNYNDIYGNNITDNGSGILVWNSINNTVSGNTIKDSGTAITLGADSTNNSVSENNITNNFFGIAIKYCSNNTFKNNIMANNTYNFGIWAISLPQFLNDVDDSNTVGTKPIYYWINRHDSNIPSDAGCVVLVNCTNIRIQNVNISRNWQGVIFAHTTNATISESNITNTEYCIWLWNSSKCHINENYVSLFIGIQLDYSLNNTIYGNTITGCGNWGGVGIIESYNNTFYGNNFTDNYIHVYTDTNSINYWDDGYPPQGIGGNYWDDFKERYPYVEDIYSGPYQNETGSDGFWDEPYIINEDNIDHYPIVPEFPSLLTLSLLMITTLFAVMLYKKERR